MRTLLIALPLSLGMAAGTLAYANIPDPAAHERSAGLLTCRTLPHVSLVFGRTRVAACRFEADRSTFTQEYGALLPPAVPTGTGQAPSEAGEMAPETIVWRVVTADGTMRAGGLDGRFVPAGPGAILRGASARLEPVVGGLGIDGVTLGGGEAAVEVGALR